MRRAPSCQLHCMCMVAPSAFTGLASPTRRAYSSRNHNHNYAGDRTRNEAIEDRQAKFQWHNRHMFRPHKAFTYDPCDWNRRLEAAAIKKRGALKIAERLRNLEERAEERHAQLKHRIPGASSVGMDGGDGAPVAVDGSDGDDVASAIASLTALLDALPLLRRGVVSARMGGSSRTTLEHQRRLDAYRTALTEAWGKVCEHGAAMTSSVAADLRRGVADASPSFASPSPTDDADAAPGAPPRMLTYEALVVCWCELLQGADVVIDFLKGAAQSAAAEDEDRATRDAIGLLYAALKDTFLSIPSDARAELRDGETNPASRVEVLVEELFVLTHPLIARAPMLAGEVEQGSAALTACVEGSVAAALADVAVALQHRIDGRVKDGDDSIDGTSRGDALASVVHAAQLARLCRTIKRVEDKRGSLAGKEEVTTKLKSLRNVLLLRELRVLCEVATRSHTERQGSVAAARQHLQPLGRHGHGGHGGALGRRRRPLVPSTPSDDVSAPIAMHSAIGSHAMPIGGTLTPAVDDEEVYAIVEAFTLTLEGARLGGDNGPPSDTTDMAKALLYLLDLLEVTPNYDLDPANVVALLHAVASSGILDRSRTMAVATVHMRQSTGGMKALWSACTNDGARSLLLRHPLLVLVSRLHLQAGGGPATLSGKSSPLAVLLWCLFDMRIEDVARAASPAFDDADEASGSSVTRVVRECKRLRGLVLHTLLNEAMDATAILGSGNLFASDDEGEGEEEGSALLLLHLVAADVPLRLRVWRSLAHNALGGGTGCRAEVAALLIALRTHVRPAQQQGPGKGPLDKVCVNVDEEDGRLLAALARQSAAAPTQRAASLGQQQGASNSFNPFLPHADRGDVLQQWHSAIDTALVAQLTDIAAHPAAPGMNDDVVVERLRLLVASLCRGA